MVWTPLVPRIFLSEKCFVGEISSVLSDRTTDVTDLLFYWYVTWWRLNGLDSLWKEIYGKILFLDSSIKKSLINVCNCSWTRKCFSDYGPGIGVSCMLWICLFGVLIAFAWRSDQCGTSSDGAPLLCLTFKQFIRLNITYFSLFLWHIS